MSRRELLPSPFSNSGGSLTVECGKGSVLNGSSVSLGKTMLIGFQLLGVLIRLLVYLACNLAQMILNDFSPLMPC